MGVMNLNERMLILESKIDALTEAITAALSVDDPEPLSDNAPEEEES